MLGKNGEYDLSTSFDKTAGNHDNLGYTEDNDVNHKYANAQYIVNTEDIKSNGISMGTRQPGPYRGMGKDELLAFSSQPFWRRLRTIVLVIVLIGWLALIIAVVALVLVYPRCRDPATRSWWQTEAIYRIYVPSFKDSNNDGIGDLQGIKSKLDYIKDLGFGVISLSPLYEVNEMPSEFKQENEMAITNHTSVHKMFGKLSDFEELVYSVHEKGMYVILDFIPNHTGDKHPWFMESANSTTRRNFYVWEEAVSNNWKSQYNGSAWTLNKERNKYFFHQYRPETPDLNLRSGLVQKELEDILNFWLDLGVDGFNVRNAAFLFEDFDLRNETEIANSVNNYNDDLKHVYTSSLPETYAILETWRSFIKAHNKTTTEKLIMAGLEGGLDATRVYGTCDVTGIQMPLNVLNADDHYCNDGTCITNYVDSWLKKVPNGKWANWMTGDENTRRFSTKFNSSLIKPLINLIFLLPGTPIILYGDEISIVDGSVNNNNLWIRSQPMRQIMKWDNTTNGGFCNDSCSPWSTLGDNPNDDGSLLTLLKDLKQLRSQQSFKIGDYFAAVRDQYVVSFVREFDGVTGYLVAINFGPNTETRDFTKSHDTIPPEEAVVVLSNGFSYSVDDKVTPNSLKLGPFGYLVVSWDYVAKEL